MLGVKNLIGLRIINDFVLKRYNVGNCLAAFVVEKSPNLFKGGNGDFYGIFAYFDFRNNISFGSLNGNQLVNSAENRLGGCGDKSLANTTAIYSPTLNMHITYQILVQGI